MQAKAHPEQSAIPIRRLEDVDGNTHAGMNAVVHVIAVIGVDDVNVIRIAPTDRPRIDERERVATIREAPAVVISAVHAETVFAAKAGRVMFVGNAAMFGITSVSSHTTVLRRLWAVPTSVALLYALLLCRLCTPCLLACLGLGLRLLLCWLRAPCLLACLGLGLPLLLCRLGIPCLWARLGLALPLLLCRPALLLRRFTFLLTLFLLRVGRSHRAEKKNQHCRTDCEFHVKCHVVASLDTANTLAMRDPACLC